MLLRLEGDIGQNQLGIPIDTMQKVISAIGNYGEIYERYFGQSEEFSDRGKNDLRRNGGYIYAPPLR